MNCEEINIALKHRTGRYASYLGCFAANNINEVIMRIKDKPVIFIINVLNEQDENMGHWITIYVNKHILIYLDSFGVDLKHYTNIYEKIIYKRNFMYGINQRIQHEKSLVCGLYAIYFVNKLTTYSVKKIIPYLFKDFSRNKLKNDQFILKYAYGNFNIPSCSSVFANNSTWNYENLCKILELSYGG